ncbi:Tim44 domain-containing protein [Bosea sp. (in: a-proteobacteria)]|uniref:Tim44 domain-containing protein n=1 Tax=Bosea sp. (in: a-proteobacteria) TaxID=1871050 RepID=UPI000B0D0818|nr:TIM44-like domain-containing protein [Bosea sp. (in: a-proteobacteria)]WRH57629.1 MAG: TIM44-like domain-containing protein [Bosea sp. (in: a-proteobacteria)]
MSLISLARRGRVVAVLAGALLLVPVLAEARPGGKGGAGSRGSRTEAAPMRTDTTPNGAQPFQRSASPSPAQAAPAAAGAAAAAQAARPSMARSLMMGVGAGLLGAGLFGLLSGSGFFSGLASMAGIFGFLLQIALIGGAIWLALRFFRRRSEPQLATAGAPLARDTMQPQQGARMGAMAGGAGAATAAAVDTSHTTPVELSGDDFNAFERLLTEINAAYSNEDEKGLRDRVTPEMFGYFDDDLTANARKGLVDRVSDVKLLQGDLSEAWGEDGFEFATVAMRFSLINALYERATGKVVEGNATVPQEVAEYWTFVRSRGGAWKLSAIQPAA